MELYLEETPIEVHTVRAVPVTVKRDDLYGRPPAPPLGKLRGLRHILREHFDSGVRLVGCWDTRVSRLGEGLAVACREYPGLRSIVSYPTRAGVPIPEWVRRAECVGAIALPVRGNHVSICYAQARRQVEAMGGTMLPFGLECREAVLSVAREAARLPAELASGTVVLSCGSGVTLAGLLLGLPARPLRVIGVSAGRSPARIHACVERYVPLPGFVEILAAVVPYDHESTTYCPFPAHPNYDLKAWQHLCDHIGTMAGPILFWNIGA